ncbi:MAG: FtsX-like permease family protein, partial [Marinoscillum sp.]
ARKYFNRTDVVGEKINFSTWLELQLEITGVTTDVPENSHLKFDFLISYETLNAQTQRDDGTISSESSWGWYDFNTYVELADNTETKTFDRKFQELVMEERNEVFEKYQFHAEFPLQPITDIHLYSNLLQESEPEEQSDGEAVFFLSIIAFFILIIAWINYINLSTARSMERAKEVGIRKTMGAYKKQLIYQFLSEAFVLNFIALIIGLLIVIGGIGYFNRLTGSLLSLEFLISSQFWLIAIGVFTLGVLLSGLYPAFVLSSFKPTSVLKGKLSGNKAGKTLRRALVTFQFAASVALIAGTLIVYQQLNHMRNIDLGFNLTNTLVIEGPQIQEGDSLYASKLSAFKNSLREQHNITNVTASSNVPGDEIFWTNNIRKQEDPDSQSKTIYIAGVDHEYFPTYDITLLAGRNYEKSHPTDTGAIILNKSAIQFLGYPNPESAINQKVHFWGTSKTIIGVVDDYRQMSAKSNVAPIVFPLIKDGSGFYTLSLTGSNFYETLTYTQEVFAQFFPEDPFDYFFLDQFFNRQYNNERNFSRVFTLFAVFGVIVACLGLFGLSSFTALQRTKEIGIRKALGSSLRGIVFLLSREFLILIGLANLIAWPLIYLVMENWLNNFATRITVNLWVFLISGFIVLVTAVCTVGYKTLSTAKSNPVKALRYE